MTMDQDTKETDDRVSRTYRALADETTPEHLNEKVLRMALDARHGAHKQTPLYFAWLKPAAWMATIGLSLAIVIEISQVNDYRERVAATPGEPAASVRDQFIPQGDNILKEAQEFARLKAGPNKEKSIVVAPIEEEIAALTTRDDSPGPAPKRSPISANSDTSAAAEPLTTAAVRYESFAMERKASTVPDACDKAARETAKLWFACIEKLHESGRTREADQENEAFTLQHPDFLPSS